MFKKLILKLILVIISVEMSKKACRCLKHEEWAAHCEGKNVIFNIKISKAVKKTVKDYLLNNSYLTSKDSFLCCFCNKKVESILKIKTKTRVNSNPPKSIVFEKEKFIENCLNLLEDLDCFGDEIRKDKETADLVKKISKSLGNLISSDIQTQGSEFSSIYKDSNLLKDLDRSQFILSCNAVVTSFLEGISGVSIENLADDKLLFTFCTVVEKIYHLKNQNFILPHHFLCNLMQSSISGSKTVSVVNGKFSPAGSYTTYNNWITEIAAQHMLKQLKLRDLDYFLDNLGRYLVPSYRISIFKNNSANIVTSSLAINLKPDESFLQGSENLKPIHWRAGKTESEIQTFMENKISSSFQHFSSFRLKYLEELISIYQNHKEYMLKKLPSFATSGDRRCTSCNKLFSGLKRKCDDCGGVVVKVIMKLNLSLIHI